MARTTYIQTNFTAGEVTPRMKGRPDVQRYQNGAETIENGIVSVHGGVVRRDGTRYVATTKHDAARRVDLVRYVFNVDQAYLLEFGHKYVRFYTSDGARLLDDSLQPLEVSTPYSEAEVFELTRAQAGDTMFLFHPNHPTYRLRRLTAARWSLDRVPWVAEPFAEVGHSPAAKLNLSAATVGSGRTFTTNDLTVPDAPTIGVASALNGAATVVFTPPADTGGSPITHYTATSSPGGITATGTSSPITVPGLSNGTPYTFTVTAHNATGASSASAASNSVTPQASLPSTSLTVTITPSNFTASFARGTHSFEGPTAAASGGSGGYTYAWSVVGGSSVVVVRGDTAQVRLRSTGWDSANYVTLRCVVRDSGGRTGEKRSTVAVTHAGGGSGGGGGGGDIP